MIVRRLELLAAIAVAAFAFGFVEGVVRGGSVVSASAGAGLLGVMAATCTAGVLSAAAGIRRVLPKAPADPWPLVVPMVTIGFVLVMHRLSAMLTARHRDPDLVAVVVAIIGVAVAWALVAVITPLVDAMRDLPRRLAALRRRAPPWLALALALAGLLILAFGIVGFQRLSSRPAGDIGPSRIVRETVLWIDALLPGAWR